MHAFFDNKPARSAFAKHLIDEDHTPKAVEILYVEGKNQKRIALESIEITKHSVHHQYSVVNRTNVNDLLLRKMFLLARLYTGKLTCNLKMISSLTCHFLRCSSYLIFLSYLFSVVFYHLSDDDVFIHRKILI